MSNAYIQSCSIPETYFSENPISAAGAAENARAFFRTSTLHAMRSLIFAEFPLYIVKLCSGFVSWKAARSWVKKLELQLYKIECILRTQAQATHQTHAPETIPNSYFSKSNISIRHFKFLTLQCRSQKELFLTAKARIQDAGYEKPCAPLRKPWRTWGRAAWLSTASTCPTGTTTGTGGP